MSIGHYVQCGMDTLDPNRPEFQCDTVICSDLKSVIETQDEDLVSVNSQSVAQCAADAAELIERFREDSYYVDFLAEVRDSEGAIAHVPARAALDLAPAPVVVISLIPNIHGGSAINGAS